MAQVGSLAVRVSADTRPYRQGMRDTRGPAQRMRRSMNQVAKRAAKMGAAIAAAGAAITAHLVRSGLDAVDTQQKLARQLGSTQAEIAGVTRAAKDAGIESGQLESNLQALNKRLGEAQEGSGRAADTLDRLGLSAQELAEMPLDERLDTIGAAINNLETQTEKAAATSDLFSRSGLNMMNAFAQGEGSIQRAADEAEQFGVAVSEVDARQIEAANDAMSRIGDVVQGISNQLAAQFAPILQGIAELLTDNARETKGFADEIGELAERGTRAFAFVADAIEGVRRVFVIVGQAAAVAALAIQKEMMRAADAILGGPVHATNALIRTMNNIPGVDIGEFDPPPIVQKIRQQMEQADRAVAEGQAAMQQTLMEPMPSETINRWVEDVQLRSAEAASSVEDAMARINQAQAGDFDGDEDEDDDEEKEREKLEERLSNVRDFLQSRREAEIADYERRKQILEDAEDANIEIEGEYRDLKEELEAKHQERLTAIEREGLSDREKFEQASMKKRVGMVSDQLENMTANVAQENKAMFRLNQAAGISNAVISAWEGYNKALAAYPPPLSYAMAGAQLAAGFSAVRQIKSQSFGSGGGGGSAPSQSGGQTTQPGTGAGEAGGQAGPNTMISLQGEVFGREQVRELLERINEEGRDGGRVTLV